MPGPPVRPGSRTRNERRRNCRRAVTGRGWRRARQAQRRRAGSGMGAWSRIWKRGGSMAVVDMIWPLSLRSRRPRSGRLGGPGRLGYSVVGSLWVCGFHRGVHRIAADRDASWRIGDRARQPGAAAGHLRPPGPRQFRAGHCRVGCLKLQGKSNTYSTQRASLIIDTSPAGVVDS